MDFKRGHGMDMASHESLVESIAARTKQFHKTQTPYRVYHGATNSTRRSQRRRDNTVDTSGLTRVLQVDRTNKTALVEPNVSMDVLVAATVAHGLVPLVVMEFPGITVGGGFSGTSGESSSFRYGAFESTINYIEIVLPNGDITTASKTERPDLFWGAASASGTLGIVTLLEVQLRDAGNYVELTYKIATNIAKATEILQKEAETGTHDFLDAIMFPDATVLCIGRMIHGIPASQTPQQFLRRRDPWFYIRTQTAKKRLKSTSASITDYIPLADYLFRYDRGGFWMGRYAFKYFLTPFNRVTRFALDPFMHTRTMYRALHQSGMSDFYMVQDVGIPYDKVGVFINWLDQNLNLYPIWLCPLRVRRNVADSNYGLHGEFADPNAPDLMNFGVWGQTSGDRAEVIRQNRALEHKVHELGGKKWLYAHTYYTEDEFWANYDRESYDRLREKYGASYLPSIYDKVKVDYAAEEAARTASTAARIRARFWSIWPLRGLYGVYKVVAGGDYLLQKPVQPQPEVHKRQ